MKYFRTSFWIVIISMLSFKAAAQNKASSLTQYGITWNFDKPYTVGQYVTGDYWVLGPVKIIGVLPQPGAVTTSGAVSAKSIYGAAAMKDDNRMRNGSMVSPKPDASQGYDSRLINYKPELSASFPSVLAAGNALISTVSNDTLPVAVLHEAIMWGKEKTAALALKTAAILTCVDKVPPTGAFRPPYSGTANATYTLANIKWDLLPKLAPVGNAPSFQQYERYFQRPWLDHFQNWVLQFTGPSENQVNYGREFSRISSTASLMLMLDVPREQKEKLMIGFLQWGIDLYGLAQNGRQWGADGGHWNGRKWPILFASILLGNDKMQQLSQTLFSEDQQYYYGTGWCGQTALFQMCFHTGPQPPYEEKAPDTWVDIDKKSENYRMVVSSGLPGTALAAQLLKAKAIWNHDAFFDYYDRWMDTNDPYAANRGSFPRPKQETKSADPFVDMMWKTYRSKVPAQKNGKDNLKWANEGKSGHFVPNVKNAGN